MRFQTIRERIAYWIAPWLEWHTFRLQVDKDGGAMALIDGEPIPVDEVSTPPTTTA